VLGTWAGLLLTRGQRLPFQIDDGRIGPVAISGRYGAARARIREKEAGKGPTGTPTPPTLCVCHVIFQVFPSFLVRVVI